MLFFCVHCYSDASPFNCVRQRRRHFKTPTIVTLYRSIVATHNSTCAHAFGSFFCFVFKIVCVIAGVALESFSATKDRADNEFRALLLEKLIPSHVMFVFLFRFLPVELFFNSCSCFSHIFTLP